MMQEQMYIIFKKQFHDAIMSGIIGLLWADKRSTSCRWAAGRIVNFSIINMISKI